MSFQADIKRLLFIWKRRRRAMDKKSKKTHGLQKQWELIMDFLDQLSEQKH